MCPSSDMEKTSIVIRPMDPPTIVCGEHYVLGLSVRPSVWPLRGVVHSGGISTKNLATNNRVRGKCRHRRNHDFCWGERKGALYCSSKCWRPLFSRYPSHSMNYSLNYTPDPPPPTKNVTSPLPRGVYTRPLGCTHNLQP